MIAIKVDLSSRLGSARDQGKRPTCIAFAASDCHRANRLDAIGPLSVEYAFFHALKRKGRPIHEKSAVGAKHISEAIEIDGQPEELGWPYLNALPSDLALYVPPSNAGTLHSTPAKVDLSAKVDAICDLLDQGRPPVILFKPTLGFHRATAGAIVHHSQGDRQTGRGHAVVGVGWGKISSSGSRAVFIRNSWGVKWCDSGHAWLAEDYLDTQMLGLIRM
jgi:papain like protease